MSRIASRFEQRRRQGGAALIPFVTAGDPDPALTVAVLHGLVRHGADLIELGMPFSDPMADGPVIQRANERALAKGVDLGHVLGAVAEFRRLDSRTPIVLMGYLNPIVHYGLEAFAADAASAGVDGVLVVDCPVEEAGLLAEPFARHGLEQIFLVAPTTSARRLTRILARAAGFVYFVSFKGITGADRLELEPVRARLAELRRASPVPVAVGFGIKDAETAAALAADADAVVVGSALVERLAEAVDAAGVERILAEVLGPLRAALDRPRSAA